MTTKLTGTQTQVVGLMSYCLGTCCRHVGPDVNAKQAHYVAANGPLQKPYHKQQAYTSCLELM